MDIDPDQQIQYCFMPVTTEHPASPGNTYGLKAYHTLSQELKKHFSEKIIKLSLDGGFTCPNRDGTISRDGCIFCSEKGSGDFAGTIFSPDKDHPNDQKKHNETSTQRFVPPLRLQMDHQRALLSSKWPQGKYIAYFQNFTNTYGPVSFLNQKFQEALAYPNVVGLAIATRPDCLNHENLQLLSRLKKQTFLWVELGLQTIHDASAEWMNRGYSLFEFDTAIEALHHYGIPVVVHTIAGLPMEREEDFIKTALYVAERGAWGIKIHMLHILRNTRLGLQYSSSPFPLMSLEQYICLLANTLCQLPPQMVIHRLTGDGSRKELLAPLWALNKRAVLNGLNQYLKKQDLWQGKYWKK